MNRIRHHVPYLFPDVELPEEPASEEVKHPENEQLVSDQSRKTMNIKNVAPIKMGLRFYWQLVGSTLAAKVVARESVLGKKDNLDVFWSTNS